MTVISWQLLYVCIRLCTVNQMLFLSPWYASWPSFEAGTIKEEAEVRMEIIKHVKATSVAGGEPGFKLN